MDDSLTSPQDPDHGAGSAYHPASRVLHWLTALLVIVTVPLGASLAGLPRVPSSFVYYDVHKSIGATLLLLVLGRLCLRIARRPAPLPATVAPWQRRAAAGMHASLYVLLLAVAVVGWLASQAGGHPLVWLNLVPMPAPVPVDETLSSRLHEVHALLAWTLVAHVVVHVLAVLKHVFVDRDDVLARMLGSRAADRRSS